MTDVAEVPANPAGGQPHGASFELSSRQTGMSFQRTRMSADRTLMSVIRTALSLISFGFTIYQFFKHLQEEHVLGATRAPRNFGAALIYLGIGMLAVGIVFHLQFMYGLRRLRRDMADDQLIHAQSGFPASYTLVVAILLLLLGIAVVANLSLHTGPFD